MNENIKEYARIGLAHQLMYCKAIEKRHEHGRTLREFVRRNDIETLDCCIPYGEQERRLSIEVVKSCGKEVVYVLHLFPLRKISLATLSDPEQAQSRLIVEDQIQVACAVGATGFIFASGGDLLPKDRPRGRKAFANFCRWFCRRLDPYGIVALLEPFDRDIDKKFLYGPTAECVELIESLKPEIDNLGVVLDIAHLPLMKESFGAAFRTVKPHLKRVHLGNCVLRDRSSSWYGDKHPPVGLEGGEIDTNELTEVLGILLDIGYLKKNERGALVFEIQPFPGQTVDQTVSDNIGRLESAWRQL